MRSGSACGSISNGTSERRYSRGKTNCGKEAEDNADGADSVTFECVHRRVTAHESNLFQDPSYPELSSSSRSNQSYTTI